MGDLGCLGIIRPCPNALLPHKKPASGQLTAEQKQENRILSRDCLLAENFFGRWKMKFGICYEVYRGELRMPSKIIRVTMAMTNCQIRRHPLRRPDGELVEESDSDHAGEARELDESSSSDDE
jgi:hypothetical protein